MPWAPYSFAADPEVHFSGAAAEMEPGKGKREERWSRRPEHRREHTVKSGDTAKGPVAGTETHSEKQEEGISKVPRAQKPCLRRRTSHTTYHYLHVSGSHSVPPIIYYLRAWLSLLTPHTRPIDVLSPPMSPCGSSVVSGNLHSREAPMGILCSDFPALMHTGSVLAFKKPISCSLLTGHFLAYLSASGSSFSPGGRFRPPPHSPPTRVCTTVSPQ